MQKAKVSMFQWLMGHCEVVECNYDLSGLPIDEIEKKVTCPECGWINIKCPIIFEKEEAFSILRAKEC